MSRLLMGVERNRSPLIIFNTAAAERLKTKSQLRKELWGWSKPPLLCRDGGWEDFGFRLHLWPQSTKSPPSLCLVSQASTSSVLCHPSSLLLLYFFQLNCSEMCNSTISTSLQMVLNNSPATHGMTHLQPKKKKNSSPKIPVPLSYKIVF